MSAGRLKVRRYLMGGGSQRQTVHEKTRNRLYNYLFHFETSILSYKSGNCRRKHMFFIDKIVYRLPLVTWGMFTLCVCVLLFFPCLPSKPSSPRFYPHFPSSPRSVLFHTPKQSEENDGTLGCSVESDGIAFHSFPGNRSHILL